MAYKLNRRDKIGLGLGSAIVATVLVITAINNPSTVESPDDAQTSSAPPSATPTATPAAETDHTASNPKPDLDRPLYIKDGAVGCNEKHELIAYEDALLRFDWSTSNRIDDGETIDGCSTWGAQEVHFLGQDENLIHITPQSTLGPQSGAGWSDALAGWVSIYDLKN